MSEISITINKEDISVKLDEVTITEVCFLFCRRILKHFKDVLSEDHTRKRMILDFVADLHCYFISLGMAPVSRVMSPVKIEVLCIAFLYPDVGIAPSHLPNITTFSVILRDNPKVALQLMEDIAIACLQAIQLKQGRMSTDSTRLIDKTKYVCQSIKHAREFISTMNPPAVTPTVNVVVKVLH